MAERLEDLSTARQRVVERLEDLSFAKLVPSILTLLGLCCGATAIRFALSHDWRHAVGAIIAAMLFAWLTGIVCLRTKGVYFIMITLAFGQMIFFVATSLAPYGGDNGLSIAARNTIAGWPLLKSDRVFYYFTLGCLLATYLVCRALVTGSRRSCGRSVKHDKKSKHSP